MAADQADHAGPLLPLWVPRDVEDQVRDAVVGAAGQGGLVVLVGGSSAGKTRLAYQAVVEELGDWRLYQPTDTSQLAAAVADGQLPRAGWVVWLDEFHHYLVGGLTLETVRALLDPDRPTVLLATLWPAWHETFTTPSSPAAPVAFTPAGASNPVRDARLILTTIPTENAVVWLDESFSEPERRRAQHLADRDGRWLPWAVDDAEEAQAVDDVAPEP